MWKNRIIRNCLLVLIASILIYSSIVLGQTSVVPKTIKNYGVRGHTFTIKERSLLEIIQERLRKAEDLGKLALLKQQFQEKVKNKIINPIAAAGITNTSVNKTFYYDPTYTQTSDILDHKGQIIVKAGTTVNPLTKVSWGKPLLFIDGEDPVQIAWAIKEQGKIVLVKGSPITLQEQIKQIIYFDQAGILTRKFKISQVPAKVSQENLQLKIEEILL